MNGTGNPQSILVNLLENPSQEMKFLLEIQGGIYHKFWKSTFAPQKKQTKLTGNLKFSQAIAEFVLEIQVSCQNIYWKIQVKLGNLEWKSMWHQRKCSGNPVVFHKGCTDLFCNSPLLFW